MTQSPTDRRDLLGVLGGMGPMATADFMRRIVELTPAEHDWQHIPVIVSSCPDIPDRVGPILRGEGDSPLPALKRRLNHLLSSGARCVVMPCNTAHNWYTELTHDCPVPFPHIIDTVVSELKARQIAPSPIGLLATSATLAAGLYTDKLAKAGYTCLEPEPDSQAQVLEAIVLTKKGRPHDAEPLIRHAIERLLERGANIVVLACTDLPPTLEACRPWAKSRTIDSNETLAKTCVAWALETRQR